MSCPDCFRGSRLLDEPMGSISTEYRTAYYAPNPATQNSDNSPKRAVILLTDAFGLPLKNSKVIADIIAKTVECDVWIPDIFDGKPPLGLDEMQEMPDRAGATLSWLDILKLVYQVIPKVPAFLFTHRPAAVDKRIFTFVEKLQADRKYDSLGVLGYCFGGQAAIRVASSDLFKSLVTCHPGNPKDAEVKAIKVPSSWALAESDWAVPQKRADQIEAWVKGSNDNNVRNCEFVVHKGTAHGFAARPNLEIPQVKEGYENALKQTTEWFRRTL